MLRSDAVAPIALLCAVGAFFSPALFGDRAIVTWNMDVWHPWAAHASAEDLARPTRVADSARQFVVMRKFATDALAEGRVPLWNPWIYCGTPFLANFQPAVFYPPNLVLSFSGLSIPDQMTASIAFHFFWALWGMYCLLRAFRLGVGAALLGAVVFGWGGHLGSRTGNQTMMATASWFPWVILATRAWFARGNARSFAGMSGALAMAGLAGFHQTFVFIVYSWAVFALIEGLAARPRARASDWFAIAGAGALALAIVSVHLVPALEFVRLAQDATNTPEMLASGTLHPWALGKLVVPDLLGHPIDANNATHLLSVGSGFYYQTERSTAVYAGLLPMLLASMVLLAPGDHRREAGWAILIGWGGLAFCFHTPLTKLASLLPGLGFSRPDRATVLWSTGVAVLAGIGAERLSGREGVGARRPAHVLPALVGLSTTAFAAAVAAWPERVLPSDIVMRVGPDYLTSVGAIAMLTGAACTLLYALRAFGVLGARGFLALAILVVAVDVGRYAWRMNFMQPKESIFRAVQPESSLEFLQRRIATEGPFRIFRYEPRRSALSGALPPSTPQWYGVEDVLGFDSMNLQRYQQVLAALDPDIVVKRANFRGTRRTDVFDSPLLDLLNVRYVVAGNPAHLPGLKLVHESDLGIQENENVLPRAFLVGEVRVESGDRVPAAMTEQAFRPDLWAYSEVPIKGLMRPAEGPLGEVQIREYRSEEVHLRVEALRRSLLVLTDSYYPGWSASVDGVEREIHRVNHVFRGVLVEPGDREVIFHYEPASFRLGVALSLAGVLFLGVGSALIKRRQLRSDSP